MPLFWNRVFFIVQHGLWETTLTEYTDPPDSAQNFTSCDESSLWRSTWQAFTVCKSATSKSPPIGGLFMCPVSLGKKLSYNFVKLRRDYNTPQSLKAVLDLRRCDHSLAPWGLEGCWVSGLSLRLMIQILHYP